VSLIAKEALRPSRLASDAFDELKLLSPFLMVVGLYIVAVTGIAQATGLASYLQLTLYTEALSLSLSVGLPAGLIIYFFYLMFWEREKRPLARAARDLTTYVLAPRVVTGLVVSLLAISYFVSAFSSFKVMIGTLNPFFLDPLLARLDALIHFGIQPWKITHFVFRGFAGTMALNFAYNFWFFLMWIFVFCQLLALAGRRERARYLLSFVLCWTVIGSVLAFLLSSAGPCYYGRVTGLPDPYAPLMHLLNAMDAPHVASGSYWHLWSLTTQQQLWSYQFLSTTSIGAGISAMPSMHVSMAYLLAFSSYRINKWLGRIMLAYAVIISIGSIDLGWHYAVDGYVSIAITYLLWRLSGAIIDRIESNLQKNFLPV